MQPNHLPAQRAVIISLQQHPGFWVLCFNKSARVSVYVYASPLGHKNYRNRGLLALD